MELFLLSVHVFVWVNLLTSPESNLHGVFSRLCAINERKERKKRTEQLVNRRDA